MTRFLNSPMTETRSMDFLRNIRAKAECRIAELGKLNLRIDMSRGVPSPEQLCLSDGLLDAALLDPPLSADGVDCRGYGGQQGILDARRLFAPLVGVPEDQVIVYGNSSLSLMYECLALAWRKGVPGGKAPWAGQEGGAAFICVVPGYDRHFSMCEDIGIRMIPVQMLDDGPDIEATRRLVANDPTIKGMWCVPKYSNPTGTVYSESVVEALASMPTAAPDFRLFWDNAYAVHPLAETDQNLADLYGACVRHGNADRALIFTSTSKVTYPGAGVGILGASPANVRWWLAAAALRSVGPDKINQLRQARFLKGLDSIKTLMEKHRRVLRPRFDRVHEIFERELRPSGLARWTEPGGGYFISLEVVPGTAKQVASLARSLGVTFATPGACFPYGMDPQDAQLRIAPSYPALDDLSMALEVIAACVLKAGADAVLSGTVI
jgi:aspartate/methionine/tyrosine aminotransferase